jgi:uncharacterized heparinase superfamily protein
MVLLPLELSYVVQVHMSSSALIKCIKVLFSGLLLYSRDFGDCVLSSEHGGRPKSFGDKFNSFDAHVFQSRMC